MAGADELSFELARAMLVATSPTEVPMLDALGVEFVEASSGSSTGDGALGFDVGHVAMAVAASSVAVAVGDYLVEIAKKYGVDAGSAALGGLVKFLRRKREAPSNALTDGGNAPDPAERALQLDQHEVSQIRDRAYKHAVDIGLSEAKADLLANALVGSLTLA